MEHASVKIKDFYCFKDEPQGFEKILPVNIIVGKNNSGKTTLLRMLLKLENDLFDIPTGNQRNILLTSVSLHQQQLIGIENKITGRKTKELAQKVIEWALDQKTEHVKFSGYFNGYGPIQKIVSVTANNGNNFNFKTFDPKALESFLRHLPNYFDDLAVKPLSVNRDIFNEPDQKINNDLDDYSSNNTDISLNHLGEGFTNSIRNYLHTEGYSPRVIEHNLLTLVNQIVEPEASFNSIKVRKKNEEWEVHLSEEGKYDIPLSDIGSGVKTVLLIVFLCEVLPLHEHKSKNTFYCIEEPENQMHPAMLRRLLAYIEEKAKDENTYFFLTTHSSVAIDMFARKENAQIVHVKHKDGLSTVETVNTYVNQKNVLDDLDVRASDILQSNGLVWLEGPSDRIYFNHWIKLMTENDKRLQEGLHYQCVFYGGRLLSHLEANDPEAADLLINLNNINRNSILIMDSDNKKAGETINVTKQRIFEELTSMNALPWVTARREIENYIPPSAVQRLHELEEMPERSGTYDTYWDYLDTLVAGEGKKYSTQKVEYAHLICEHITFEDIENDIDLHDMLKQAVDHIKNWNGISEPNAPISD